MNFNEALTDVDRSIRSLDKVIAEMRMFANENTNITDPQHSARVKAKEAISSQRLPNALAALRLLRADLVGLGAIVLLSDSAASGDYDPSQWDRFASGPHQQVRTDYDEPAPHEELRPASDALGEPGPPVRTRKTAKKK